MEYPHDTWWVIVTNIVDGDTVDVVIDQRFHSNRLERIRLKDCWAKELSEPGGLEAKNHLEELIRNNCFINTSKPLIIGHCLILDSFKTDSFGRYLGILYGKDMEISINEKMILDGFATMSKVG